VAKGIFFLRSVANEKNIGVCQENEKKIEEALKMIAWRSFSIDLMIHK
jgi:hypothetical protein